jgi:O-antigen/teichoic acid export membrane protein
MTQPPDQRDRPLHLAIRSLRLLGAACVGYGIFFVFAYGYLNRYERYQIYFMAMGMILWVVPGAIFLVNVRQIEQRQRRAALCAICIAAAQGLCAAALFVMNFLFTPISPIPVVLSALWVAAEVQLVMHLRQSLPLLEIDAERRHGFDVTVLPDAKPLDDDHN